MSKRAKWVPVFTVVAAALAACGEDGGTGGGPSVELQVLAGIAVAPVTGYIVHVQTPRTNATKPLGSGDQTQYANWTKLNLNLQDGDRIRISVLAGADTLTTGECDVTLEGAADATYARAVAFYFAPPNNYVDCADNLDLP